MGTKEKVLNNQGMSDVELRERLDNLAKRAGASAVLAEMLAGQLSRQEQELSEARAMLPHASSESPTDHKAQLLSHKDPYA